MIRPNFVTYAAYVALFPQLIAGPIVRYDHVDRQLSRILRGIPWRRALILVLSGFALFAIGLFKKVVIADTLAQWANPVFAVAGEQGLSTRDAWIAALAYTFQLYFDFSAYSDMALGLGRMFGLIFPANFYSPYKSRSIAEFWRRWHMSLSYFVRDYIYIPLGGSKRGRRRQAANLLVAFTLVGAWHGAGYTFLLWGAYHGVLVVASHLTRSLPIRAPHILGVAVTFFLVVVGWVLFRATSLESAWSMYSAMFSISDGRRIFLEAGHAELGIALIGAAAAVAFFAPNALELLGSRSHTLLYGLRWPAHRWFARPVVRRVLMPLTAGAAIFFGVTSLVGLDSSFLYFNF